MPICFAPIVPDDARILILGSMPGEESLRRREYYAKPSNQFWTILGQVFGEAPGTMYEEKRAFLYAHRIALWDVYAECAREGSLDSAIGQGTVNDFTTIFAQHPTIQTIILNGRAAEKAFRTAVQCHQSLPSNLQILYVPSSSPTPGRNVKTLVEKIAPWKVALL